MMQKIDPWKTWVLYALTYLFTLLVTTLTTGILNIYRNEINPTIISLIYLLPVGLSTTLWGLGPGIVAALASFLALNYFFIPPYYSLTVHQTQDLLGLLVFLAVSIGISQLVGRVRKSLSDATAREHEAIRLFDFSSQLVGMQDVQEIAHTLAEQVLVSFHAERIAVIIEAGSGLPPIHLALTDEAHPEPAAQEYKPALLIPLQSSQGFLGEIQVWRTSSLLSSGEERLLQTFASLAVIALERARLAQAERRARVLEESDRLKSSLLSSVSHELRTPLATIKASVTSLRSETVPWESEARTDLLAAVEEETDHLNQLVGNLLDMARIEDGALKPQRSWNSLAEIISSSVKRTNLQTQHHKVEVDISDELPLVPVDYLLIEQVFTNLLSNSAKYSPDNTTVRIRARQADDRTLQVTVSNQGPPVLKEHLERIFDKFYRITAAERITGSGLGLSICKGLVEAHGGRIWAENLQENDHPAGFAFHFTLPLTAEGFPEVARPRPEVE